MARYGWRDQRAARRLMREAGAFKVGGRLVLRADDLDRYERERRAQAAAPTAAASPRRSRPAAIPAPGWWRNYPPEG
jgi:hypothetical protein